MAAPVKPREVAAAKRSQHVRLRIARVRTAKRCLGRLHCPRLDVGDGHSVRGLLVTPKASGSLGPSGPAPGTGRPGVRATAAATKIK